MNLKVQMDFIANDDGSLSATKAGIQALDEEVQKATAGVAQWRQEQAQAAAVGQAFEEALRRQGVSMQEYAQWQQEAAAAAKDHTGIVGQLSAALGDLGGVGAEAGHMLEGLTGSLAGMMAIVVAIDAEVLKMVSQFADWGNELQNLSTASGLSVNTLNAWNESASVTGVSAQKIATDIERLSARVEMGNKQAAQGLAALGMSTQQYLAMSPEERLAAIAEGLAGISDKGQQAAVATELFSRGGLRDLPAFTEQAQELRDRLQGIAGDETGATEEAKAYKEQVALLGAEWEKLEHLIGEVAASNLMGPIKAVVDLGEAIARIENEHPGFFRIFGAFTGLSSAIGAAGAISGLPQIAAGAQALAGENGPRVTGATAASISQGKGIWSGALSAAEAAGEMPDADKVAKGAIPVLQAQQKAIDDVAKANARAATEQAKLNKELEQGQAKASAEMYKLLDSSEKDAATSASKLAEAQAAQISPLDAAIQKAEDLAAKTIATANAKEVEAALMASMNPQYTQTALAIMQNEEAVKADAAATRDSTIAKLDEADATKAQMIADSVTMEEQKVNAETEAAIFAKKIADAKALQEAMASLGQTISGLGQQMAGLGQGALGSLFGGVGGAISGVSGIEKSIASFGKDASGNALTGLTGILSKAGSALGIAGAAVGIGEALFNGIKSVFGHDEGKTIGNDFGGGLSKGTVDAVLASEKQFHLGRALAEDLNIDAILKDTGADPATMSGRIGDLMNAVKLGAIPAKDGIASLGKAFTDLKTAADGGSVSSEAAMVKMIQRAKELGESIPELDAAVAQMLDDARAGLEGFYGGLTQGAGGTAQAGASQTLFDAVYQASVGQLGLADTVSKFQGSFDAMVKSMAPGTALTGGAAQFAQLEMLMKNKEFAGAATGGSDLAKTAKGLIDSGNLTPAVVAALGTSATTLFQQALGGAGASGLKGADADRVALQAVLPVLTQLQHAQEMGATLTPEEQGLMAKAQADGMLPMKTVAEQQLDMQRQTRDAVFTIAKLPIPQVNVTIPGASTSAPAGIPGGSLTASLGTAQSLGAMTGAIHAASGFEGMISKPTPFLVGEGGQPEYVSVTPGGQKAGGNIALNVHPGAVVIQGSNLGKDELQSAVEGAFVNLMRNGGIAVTRMKQAMADR